jgi:hypothetical protein
MGRVKGLLGELVSFGSPRAIVIDLGAILATLALWPTDRLQYVPVRSVWENVFHVRPYSSGMMRALSRLLHGDVPGAWAFNKLAFLALPLMAGLVAVNAVRWYRTTRLKAAPAPMP